MCDRLDCGICRISDRNDLVGNDLEESVIGSMKKNLTLKETIFVASMLFGMFLWCGKPDLSGIDGTACRRTDVAGSRWIFDHRSRLAVIRRGGAWDQP
mgnify:CR=1 FL=1